MGLFQAPGLEAERGNRVRTRGHPVGARRMPPPRLARRLRHHLQRPALEWKGENQALEIISNSNGRLSNGPPLKLVWTLPFFS